MSVSAKVRCRMITPLLSIVACIWGLACSQDGTAPRRDVPPDPHASSYLYRDRFLDDCLGLCAPCSYDLEYRTIAIGVETEPGRQLALCLEDPTHEFARYSRVRQLIEVAEKQLGPIAVTRPDADPRVFHASPRQVFSCASNGACAMQRCESEPNFPAIVRAESTDIVYFAYEGRLDVMERSASLILFTPATMFTEFPCTLGKAAEARKTDWRESALAGHRKLLEWAPRGGSKFAFVLGQQAGDTSAAAWWWSSRSAKRARSAAFVDVFTGSGSDTSEARTCIRIEGGETVLTVTEYRVTNYLRLKAGDPVVLEIDTPKKVRDLRQGDPPGIVDIAELGDDITRMLRVRGGAAVGK